MERRIALILAGLLYLSAAAFIVHTKRFDAKMVSEGVLIYNQRGMYANRVRTLIKQLDGAGESISSRTAWIPGDLPPFGREYFEESVLTVDATYRVSVGSIDSDGSGGVM